MASPLRSTHSSRRMRKAEAPIQWAAHIPKLSIRSKPFVALVQSIIDASGCDDMNEVDDSSASSSSDPEPLVDEWLEANQSFVTQVNGNYEESASDEEEEEEEAVEIPSTESTCGFDAPALILLRVEAERYLSDVFLQAHEWTVRRKAVTMNPSDLALVHRMNEPARLLSQKYVQSGCVGCIEKRLLDNTPLPEVIISLITDMIFDDYGPILPTECYDEDNREQHQAAFASSQAVALAAYLDTQPSSRIVFNQ